MYGSFTLVTLSKARSVSERKQLLPGRCCVFSVAGAALGSEIWAFGLGIFDVFCHYMLSSGGLVGRFCPMVQLASATHVAAAFPGSDLGASELVVSIQSTSTVDRQQIRS